MKVALVHDYLNEYGGAERVLKALSEIWPDAPIYTAFVVKNSTAGKEFAHKKIIISWFGKIPGFRKLYSPLRFLIPWVWGSFNFKGYDLIITSASWYVTKGLGKKYNVPEICYCHTPPRWLYGYPTSVNFQKYWLVRVYALIVGHFLRIYDFEQAQKVDVFVANSKEVANRIRKFYRLESQVIYPPIAPPKVSPFKSSDGRGDYYLSVSRIVGGKGIEMAVKAAEKYGFKLKIAGESAGFGGLNNVETLGYVTDEEKAELMTNARGFLALEKSADFGMTPVESIATGTAVIAFNGGGYKETVIDGKTGVLFDDYSVEGLMEAIKRFEKINWKRSNLVKHSEKFLTSNFKKQMLSLANKYA